MRIFGSAAGTRAARLQHPMALQRLARFVIGESDPNDRRAARAARRGPLRGSAVDARGATARRTRTRTGRPCRRHGLHVEFDALATRVLLDCRQARRSGVEYLKGKNLYRASPNAARRGRRVKGASAPRAKSSLPAARSIRPQLLMLSGIGPPDSAHRSGDQSGSPAGGCRSKSAGPLRGRASFTRHRVHGPACEDAQLRRRRCGLPRLARRARHVYFQRRGGRIRLAVEPAPGKPGLVRHGAADALLRIFSRLLRYHPQQSRRSDLRAAEGAYQQSRRNGHAASRAIRATRRGSIFTISRKAPIENGDDLAAVVEGIRRIRRMSE